jgi:basic membrane protein A
MVTRRARLILFLVLIASLILPACASNETKKVCVVLDTGGENDRGFNEYTLKGARQAATEAGLDFAHIVSTSEEDYARHINRFVEEDCGLILTVGFLMADATATAARENPDIQFAIIDVEYFPGAGCPAEVEDCYTEAGGLSNVTSLMFAEDQVGFLAGTLAGCMTQTGVIGSVSGMEIPPVVRFVVGYQNGAQSFNPDIETLNVYIPQFNDPYTGKQEGERQIKAGADILFGVGGNTGNGGLLAASDMGLMTIGVDVDQFLTFPEIAPSLLTSASKNVDVAAYNAVKAYADGTLEGGQRQSNVANDGVGLAPYHQWEGKIPEECKAAVEKASEGLISGVVSTGYGS